jgi:YD repeat-containing protein
VSIGYDNADRRKSLTVQNGVVVEYAYDDASNLAGLMHSLNGTTIGTVASPPLTA